MTKEVVINTWNLNLNSENTKSNFVPMACGRHDEVCDGWRELIDIKNGLFKGEYVEILFNLTLKLQNHLIQSRSKTNKS